MITQERLKELLYYHPESGDFVWLVQHGRSTVGMQAGTLVKGYVRIGVDGEKIKAHRLAFLYMTGILPPQVDHENMVRHDNVWDNLREADGTQQNANKILQRNNKSGVRGVSRFQNRYWRAMIKGKLVGYFKNKDDAAAAYQAAAQEHFGDFVRL
jgi:HNH endonuclease